MSEISVQAQRRPHWWHNNPALVQLLGLSPLLATTTTTSHGIALGLSTAIVLMLGSLTIKLCQDLFSTHWRFVFYLFVLAVFTTMIDLILRKYFFALHRELGLYTALICCNFALLLHVDTQLHKDAWWQILTPTAMTGAGIVLALAGFAALRELLIYGSLLADWQLLLPVTSATDMTPVTTPPVRIAFAKLAPAAFFLLALLLALRNLLQPQSAPTPDAETVTPVTRARVTGKIQLP